MCESCGCSPTPSSTPKTLEVHTPVLSQNLQHAMENRSRFKQYGTLALNILSSPGSGKTALIERTMKDLHPRLPCAVIVGDLATDLDAQRLRRSGAPAIQINTGSACHLDAASISKSAASLDVQPDVLFIENVGNLVCPAAFDLGENARVVLLSVTEGEDKPLKYPVIFERADLVLITKTDLVEAASFDLKSALAHLDRVAPRANIIQVSAKTGAGLERWYHWIRHEVAHQKGLPH